MTVVLIAIIAVAVLVLVGAAASIHILKQYERAVKFRLGRVGDARTCLFVGRGCSAVDDERAAR